MKIAKKYIQDHNLKFGDAIVIKKSFFDIIDPYAIFLGNYGNKKQPIFWVRNKQGIRFLKEVELNQLFRYFPPKRINRFIGSNSKRNKITQYAISNPNSNSFSLILNQCEDYASFHKTKSISKGSRSSGWEVAGIAALVLIGIGIIASLNDDE